MDARVVSASSWGGGQVVNVLYTPKHEMVACVSPLRAIVCLRLHHMSPTPCLAHARHFLHSQVTNLKEAQGKGGREGSREQEVGVTVYFTM